MLEEPRNSFFLSRSTLLSVPAVQRRAAEVGPGRRWRFSGNGGRKKVEGRGKKGRRSSRGIYKARATNVAIKTKPTAFVQLPAADPTTGNPHGTRCTPHSPFRPHGRVVYAASEGSRREKRNGRRAETRRRGKKEWQLFSGVTTIIPSRGGTGVNSAARVTTPTKRERPLFFFLLYRLCQSSN